MSCKEFSNIDHWISQYNNSSTRNEEDKTMTTTSTNMLETHLLSLKDEHQNRIRPNLHPTYNAYHKKIRELIDWTLETFTTTANIQKTQQNEERQQQEVVTIDNILNET